MAFWIGVLLLIPACWLYARAFGEEHSGYWQRLVVPLSLVPGRINTPEFAIGQDGDYDIFVEFEPRIDFQKMQCLLGIAATQGNFASRCKDTPELIDISWELFEGGKIVQIAPTVAYQGDSREYPSISWEPGAAIRRQIGRFRGQKGHRYTLALNIKQDASRLNIANPKLAVTVPRGVAKDRYVGLYIQKLGASILGLIGAMVFLYGIFVLEFVPTKP